MDNRQHARLMRQATAAALCVALDAQALCEKVEGAIRDEFAQAQVLVHADPANVSAPT